MLRPSLSPGALQVHATALLASFEAGRAGFVRDDDLGDVSSRAAGVPLHVLELCVAGVWTFTEGGYRVAEAEARRMADVLTAMPCAS